MDLVRVQVIQSARCQSNLAKPCRGLLARRRENADAPFHRDGAHARPLPRRIRKPREPAVSWGSRSDLSGGLPLGWELDGMLREMATAGRRCGPASTLASVGAGQQAAPA